MAALMMAMKPSYSPLTKSISLSMGSEKIFFARSQVRIGWSASRHHSDTMNFQNASMIDLPSATSLANWSSSHLPALSRMPYWSSALVISSPPGMKPMMARRMLAPVRSTFSLLIGFWPMMTQSMRNPGMLFALSAM